MKKSKISVPREDEFLTKPYKNIPKKIEERLRPRDFVVTEEAILRHDGKQFSVRVPLRVSRALELDENKLYFLRFTVRKPPPKAEGKTKVEIEFGEKL